MKKLISVMMVLIMLVSVISVPVLAKTKVKVAYPIQKGLTEISNEGIYSGYTYDYLKELERFTDFEFEFVTLDGDENEQITVAMEKVQKGELDMMGAMIYDESLTDMYDYTSTNYGMGNMAIYVLSDNEKINDTNIYSLKDLNVGIVSGAKKENVKLKEFGKMNGIEIKQHFFDSTANMQAALDNNEIEAIAFSEQAAISGNYRIVATFSPRPFYLVTTKGNTDLIIQLNESMTKLNKEQPSFMGELHEKYFSLKNADFSLTDKEKEFIKVNPIIDVAILGGNAPFQSKYGKDGYSGITIDVLDYISKLCGIKFNYHFTDSYDEYMKIISDQNILITGGITSSYVAENYGFSLSRSYLDSQIQIIMRTGIDSNNIKGKRLALSKNLYYTSEENKNISFYDTVLECIQAVNNGEADYTYLTSHTALFYSSAYKFNNITIIPHNTSSKIKNCLAVRDNTTPLINILNKGIDNVTNDEIQSIVFKNGTYAKGDTSLLSYINNNQIQFISFIIILAGAYMISRFYSNKKNDEKIIKEYNRFQQISDLSGDCFIEYSVQTDRLSLSGGAAKLLSDKKSVDHYLVQDHPGIEIMKKILESKRTYDEEILVTFKDGTKRWQRVFLQPLFNDSAKITHIIGKITDIQAQKEEQLLWKNLASKDSLTKVYNSAACRELIEGFLKESSDNDLAFIILDIDNFKSINDTYGHLYGDQVLQNLAHAITITTGPTDFIGRVGGDEFVIGLKYPKSQEAVEKYCKLLMRNISDGQRHTLTTSIGIAFSREKQNYDDIYLLADLALYEVKKEGRNDYRFANSLKS